MPSDPSKPFPSAALLPKSETNADAFLAAHPQYDGRDVIVGILDTGVDPGSFGMQHVTVPSDGDEEEVGGGGGRKPKLIDMVDCTGSGDVDVSKEVLATFIEGEGSCWEVKGLSGRTLRLNREWSLCPFPGKKEEEKKKSNSGEAKGDDKETNAGTKDNAAAVSEQADQETKKRQAPVRLGIKRAFELFPNRLVSRVKSHRRIAFDAERRKHAASVRAEMQRWHTQNPDAKTVTKEAVKVRDDLQARLDVLETTKEGDELYDDPGPVYDCVVFHDGTRYRAAVDVKEDGDLSTAEGMTDFRYERQYGTFGTVDLLNYAVNIYDEGTVLSIVCDAGSHGSHVAGIAAGFHPPSENGGGGIDGVDEKTEEEEADDDEEEALRSRNRGIDCMSGVAPGAQIISFKIGDTRLGSMETGTALTRALIEAIRRKCDVINLSYGEGCALANSGRFIELAEDLVHRHGIIFVSSAGNNGPAISTVGAPGGTTDAIIGVAAYVSPEMMEAEYSMIQPTPAAITPSSSSSLSDPPVGAAPTYRHRNPGTTYTWSSVGPTHDGSNGVDLTAPGGAIASVPNWTLQRNQLMNGTSMSSPHATGCVALLLSACKAEGVPVSPSRIRRAMENTARTMEGLGRLEQGCGMIQVDKAWDYLRSHKDSEHEDVYYKVYIDNRAGHPRGVYLRQPLEVAVRQTVSVHVDPRFRKGDFDRETQRRRVEFEVRFNLTSTASWVHAPDHLILMHNGRSFKVEIDPAELPEGVHTANVLGYDSANPDRGPMFSVPITVVRPMEEKPCISLGELQFEPTERKRFFLSVPPGATWMDVTLRDCRDVSEDADSSPRMVVLHTVQLLPHKAYRDAESQKYFNLLPSQVTVSSIPVHAGVTCEMTLARYWSAVGSTRVDATVQFRGIVPVPEVVTLSCGNVGSQVRVSSDLKDESIQPSAKLTKWKTPIRPKAEGVVSPLKDRDVWPSEEKRIYELVLTYEFNQEEAGTFVPRAPALQGVLYESAYESQLMMIFDGDKKFLGVADSWPSEVKVPKGNVTIRLQIRHDEPEMLDNLKDLTIWIERKLGKEISLSAYPSHKAMMIGKDPMKKRTLRKGTSTSVFFAEPTSSKLPSGCKSGDVLSGTASYASGEASLPGDGKKPGGFPLRFVVGPKLESKNASESSGITPEVPDERTVKQKLEEAVRQLKVEELEKLAGKEKEAEKFEELYSVLLEDYGDHIPLRMAGLKFHDRKEKREDGLEKVVEASDEVMKLIPEKEVAAHFGMEYDKEDPKSCKERKDMDERKAFLIEALARKTRAVADIENSRDESIKSAMSFDDMLNHLKKWVDIDANNKYAVLALEREKRAGRLGSVLKLLNSLLKNKGEDTKGGICPLSKSDLLERRAKVFQELGYSMLVENDKKWRLISAPESFALF